MSHPPPLPAASKPPKVSNGLLASTHWSLQIHETPSKFRYLGQVDLSKDTTIDVTPGKVQPAANDLVDKSPSSLGKEESIYAALGWDDDIDELL